MNPISTRNSSNIPNPFSQNIMLTRPRRRIMHKGNPDGIRMKLSRRWWKLNIKLPPCIKRKKERRKKRWKQKGKKGERRTRRNVCIDVGISPIYPIRQSEERFLIEYANRRSLICRKMIESDDGSLGSQDAQPVRGSCFREQPARTESRWTDVQTLHVLRSGILNRTRLSAHVRQLSKRETIVSFLRWVRFAPFDYRGEERRAKTYGGSKNCESLFSLHTTRWTRDRNLQTDRMEWAAAWKKESTEGSKFGIVHETKTRDREEWGRMLEFVLVSVGEHPLFWKFIILIYRLFVYLFLVQKNQSKYKEYKKMKDA